MLPSFFLEVFLKGNIFCQQLRLWNWKTNDCLLLHTEFQYIKQNAMSIMSIQLRMVFLTSCKTGPINLVISWRAFILISIAIFPNLFVFFFLFFCSDNETFDYFSASVILLTILTKQNSYLPCFNVVYTRTEYSIRLSVNLITRIGDLDPFNRRIKLENQLSFTDTYWKRITSLKISKDYSS